MNTAHQLNTVSLFLERWRGGDISIQSNLITILNLKFDKVQLGPRPGPARATSLYNPASITRADIEIRIQLLESVIKETRCPRSERGYRVRLDLALLFFLSSGLGEKNRSTLIGTHTFCYWVLQTKQGFQATPLATGLDFSLGHCLFFCHGQKCFSFFFFFFRGCSFCF